MFYLWHGKNDSVHLHIRCNCLLKHRKKCFRIYGHSDPEMLKIITRPTYSEFNITGVSRLLSWFTEWYMFKFMILDNWQFCRGWRWLGYKICVAVFLSFVHLTFECILQSEPEFRPPMSEVVQDLVDMIRRERCSNESLGDWCKLGNKCSGFSLWMVTVHRFWFALLTIKKSTPPVTRPQQMPLANHTNSSHHALKLTEVIAAEPYEPWLWTVRFFRPMTIHSVFH